MNRQKITNEELISELRRVAKTLGFENVTKNEFKKHGKYGDTIYGKRFGSWYKANIAAGLEGYDHGKKRKANFKRVRIRSQVKLNILRRDKHQCCLCHKSPNRFPYPNLQIDHIIPVSKGGSNDESNLWTLCQKCNRAKSDKLDHVIISKAKTHLMWCDITKRAAEYFKACQKENSANDKQTCR